VAHKGPAAVLEIKLLVVAQKFLKKDWGDSSNC
jgi:hypothetical protein